MHVAVTPLHQNVMFISKVVKHIEKMKVTFTKPACLHQVITCAGREFQTKDFLRSNGRFCVMHFYDGSEMHIIHCKNLWLLMILVFVRSNFNKHIVKCCALSTYKNNDKTGVF